MTTPKARAKKRSRSVLEAPPTRVVAIAKELQTLTDVVCVVWGSRKTGKRWFHGDRCLSVHVRKKKPKTDYTGEPLPDTLAGLRALDLRKVRKRPLPKKIEGYRVDVLEVGKPKHHSLSVKGRLDAGNLGISTPTVVGTKGADAMALVSGHAARDASNVRLCGFDGGVLSGKFGQGLSVDWALVSFAGAAKNAETNHPAAGTSSPLGLSAALASGAKLTQFSGERGAEVKGILQGVVPSNIHFGGAVYSSLLSILRTSTGPPFSVEGDSGSLIVDEDGLAVAAVVGGDESADTFYAYDLRGLRAELSAANFARFFKDS